MKLLDLYCCAGGAAMGYHRTGFDEIVGVDINPQRHYPFEFVQGDAIAYLEEHGREFDYIHASPPCQRYSSITAVTGGRENHPDLVNPTRQALIASGIPYTIENVVGAPLINPIVLCGTMFGLRTKGGAQLRRHRLFELSRPFNALVPPCQHRSGLIEDHGGAQGKDYRRIPPTIGVYGNFGGNSTRDRIRFFSTQDGRDAMDIQWMTGKELSQAVPPAYTEFIAKEWLAWR